MIGKPDTDLSLSARQTAYCSTWKEHLGIGTLAENEGVVFLSPPVKFFSEWHFHSSPLGPAVAQENETRNTAG